MDKIYLFTTSRCPACPAAKQFVADNGLEEQIEMVVADASIDAMTLAENFNVRMVPTFVIQREEDGLHEGISLSLPEFKQQFETNFATIR